MVKLSEKYTSMYNTDEISKYLQTLMDSQEVIDISGVTFTQDIAVKLQNYANKYGHDKVVGTDVFEDIDNRDIKNIHDTILINTKSKENLQNIERSFQNGGAFITLDLPQDENEALYICLFVLILSCKYRNAELSMSNKDIESVISIVRPLVLPILFEKPAESYLWLNGGPHYKQYNGESLDKLVYEKVVPDWFFGLKGFNPTKEDSNQFIKYFNKLKELFINNQEKVDEVYKKNTVMSFILKGD